MGDLTFLPLWGGAMSAWNGFWASYLRQMSPLMTSSPPVKTRPRQVCRSASISARSWSIPTAARVCPQGNKIDASLAWHVALRKLRATEPIVWFKASLVLAVGRQVNRDRACARQPSWRASLQWVSNAK